ncbi:MAG TPA: hypothetical protein DCS93_34475 [Microscillaceae bacterium]|nr:hypothetical protein [Microscillaceae bacterium]
MHQHSEAAQSSDDQRQATAHQQKARKQSQTNKRATIQAKHKPIQCKAKPPIQAKQKPIQAKQALIQRSTSPPAQTGAPEGSAKFKEIATTLGEQHGVDTSALKATHNSSFPGTVNAAATIQANKIDFAPGEDTTPNMKHEVAHYIDNAKNGTPPGDRVINGQKVDTTREKVVDKMMSNDQGKMSTSLSAGEANVVQRITPKLTNGDMSGNMKDRVSQRAIQNIVQALDVLHNTVMKIRNMDLWIIGNIFKVKSGLRNILTQLPGNGNISPEQLQTDLLLHTVKSLKNNFSQEKTIGDILNQEGGVFTTLQREFEILYGNLDLEFSGRETLLSVSNAAGSKLQRGDNRSFGQIPNQKPGIFSSGTAYNYTFADEPNRAQNLKAQITQNIKGDDVKQGKIGACYLYAALSSLAELNPNFIKSMFTTVTETQATIRLFTSKGKPVYISVDRTKVSGWSTKKDYQIEDQVDTSEWVRLIIKAYIVAGFTGKEGEEVSDNDIGKHLQGKGLKTIDNSAGSGIAMGHLTGQQQDYTTPVKIDMDNTDIDVIKDALKAGKAVTCCFMNISNLIWLGPKTLDTNHIYSVLGYESGKFLIRNPWGYHTPTQIDDGSSLNDNNSQGDIKNMKYDLNTIDDNTADQGRFVLTENEFEKNASWVTINNF